LTALKRFKESLDYFERNSSKAFQVNSSSFLELLPLEAALAL